jgi:hypothetical protein
VLPIILFQLKEGFCETHSVILNEWKDLPVEPSIGFMIFFNRYSLRSQARSAEVLTQAWLRRSRPQNDKFNGFAKPSKNNNFSKENNKPCTTYLGYTKGNDSFICLEDMVMRIETLNKRLRRKGLSFSDFGIREEKKYNREGWKI